MTHHAPFAIERALAPVVSIPSPDTAAAILSVAEALQPDLAQGFQIDALRLRLEMERAFGGSDATGDWDWKLAYEAGEAALVLFLRKFGRALLARAGSPAALLPILAKVMGLLPTHTRRSEEMERFQQFSTPLPMGLAALAAAQITPCDLVLEPSAGTGLLAILAEIAGGNLALNELADTRADLLRLLFPGRPVTRFDAAQIDDHLDAGVRPNVILMNPPFSAVANVDSRTTDATARHLRSGLARLAWEDVLRIINGPLPDARRWTQSRLLRAVKAYVRDGFLPAEVLDRAGRRETDDRLPALVAAIKGADPDITLQAICDRLQAMRERTPRGRTSWQPSSVKMLLERAERLGLLE